MEEDEDLEAAEDDGGTRISGFAASLAAHLVKETLDENRSDQENDWSIPCSSDCHSNLARGANTSEAGEAGKMTGHLCWTPESSGSIETGSQLLVSAGTEPLSTTCRGPSRTPSPGPKSLSTTCRIKSRTPSPGPSQNCQMASSQPVGGLKKGVSVPNVDLSDIVDSVSVSGSENSSRTGGKVGFFRHFGKGETRGKNETGIGSSELSGKKRGVRSQLRKTLSSLFNIGAAKSDGDGDKSPKSPRHSIFRLPSRKPRSVPPCQRALPPVPGVVFSPPSPISTSDTSGEEQPSPGSVTNVDSSQPTVEDSNIDFAASIEKVKDHGWYWGPLSGEAAERILAPEPDGSFVVRDSSDHHYIFSLTFKLNGFVRHVRIEHDQGNFSFGSFTKFKSTTIVDFIENAVEHSRSGRYLFFLHRRPVLGPMRVQLLHPVSRFKRVQSLQHLCRYIIVKHVRKDHLDQLPVPNRIKTYLNTPFYYSEQVTEEMDSEDSGLHQIDPSINTWQINDSSDDQNEVNVNNSHTSEVVDDAQDLDESEPRTNNAEIGDQ